MAERAKIRKDIKMAGFNYVFDATQYAPEQSAGAHPIGKFAAVISGTELKPIKDDPEGRPRFVVEFTTEAGRINLGYNLWSANMKAVDISHKQLSALSHATGIFRINMGDEGAALRGARLMIEVGKQKEGEYTEVKKVFDVAGNEPGRGPVAQQPSMGNVANAGTQQFGGPATMQANGMSTPSPIGQNAQPNASLSSPPAASQPAWGNPASAAPAWGGQPTQAAPPQAPAAQAPAWAQQPGGAAANGQAPAWAR